VGWVQTDSLLRLPSSCLSSSSSSSEHAESQPPNKQAPLLLPPLLLLPLLLLECPVSNECRGWKETEVRPSWRERYLIVCRGREGGRASCLVPSPSRPSTPESTTKLDTRRLRGMDKGERGGSRAGIFSRKTELGLRCKPSANGQAARSGRQAGGTSRLLNPHTTPNLPTTTTTGRVCLFSSSPFSSCRWRWRCYCRRRRRLALWKKHSPPSLPSSFASPCHDGHAHGPDPDHQDTPAHQ